MSAIHRYTVQGHMVNTPPYSRALSTEFYMCGILIEPAVVAIKVSQAVLEERRDMYLSCTALLNCSVCNLLQ